MDKVLFSHKKDNWKTPKEIYRKYIEMGCFDPCPENPSFDGLKIEWKEKNFVNPPFSQIALWAKKAIEEYNKGKMIIFHAPARTDTKWFHLFLETKNARLRFYKGRLHYDDGKNGAPFPTLEIWLIPPNRELHLDCYL